MKFKDWYLVITLQFVMALPAVSTIIISPALVDIQHDFLLIPSTAQYVITIFMVGYAIGQLLYGPLSRRYGRKPILFFGIGISFLFSFLSGLCYYIDSFPLLIIFRFLNALGASAGYVLSFAIINDIYSSKEARKIVPLVAFGLLLYPYLSITLGGLINEFLGWAYCFFILGIYTLFIFLLLLFIPETISDKNSSKISIKETYYRYLQIYSKSNLLLFSSLVGFCVSIYYIFSATAPFIGIGFLKESSAIYGLYNLIPLLSFIVGNFLTIYLAKACSSVNVIISGALVIFIGILITLIYFLFGLVNMLTLFIPSFLIFIGVMLVWGNATVLATKDIEDKSHAVSAMSFINVGVAVFAVIITGIFHVENPLVLPWMIFSVAVLIVLGAIAGKVVLKSSHKDLF